MFLEKPPRSDINSEDQAVLAMLRLERDARRERARQDAREYHEYLTRDAQQMTLEGQLAQASLRYMDVRHAFATSRKGRRQARRLWKQRQKTICNPALRQYVRRHSAFGSVGDSVKPELLYPTEPDTDAMLRQGWTVDYQRGPFPAWGNRSVHLMSSFVLQHITSSVKVTPIHRITAYEDEGGLHADVTEADDYERVDEDELLFPLGLVVEATKQFERRR